MTLIERILHRMSTDWPPPAFDPVTGELLDDDDAALAAPNVAEYSVSEISGALKRTLEDTFGHIRVRGELGRVSGRHRAMSILTSRTTARCCPA
jgi:hypothetical protein